MVSLEMPKDLFPILFPNIHFDDMTTQLDLSSTVNIYIYITSDIQVTPPLWQKAKKN